MNEKKEGSWHASTLDDVPYNLDIDYISKNQLDNWKNFVLNPLADIAKSKIHPILNDSIINLLNKLRDELESIAQVDQEPSLEGRQLLMVLSPLKKK